MGRKSGAAKAAAKKAAEKGKADATQDLDVVHRAPIPQDPQYFPGDEPSKYLELKRSLVTTLDLLEPLQQDVRLDAGYRDLLSRCNTLLWDAVGLAMMYDVVDSKDTE